jgi:hypothetical protein
MKMIRFVPFLFRVFSLINCTLINKGKIELAITLIPSGLSMEILLMLKKILELLPWY